MTLNTSVISERRSEIQSRIERAAQRAGRDPADVLLVAVTKTHGADVIQAAYDAGLQHFGENRVEEAESKIVTSAAQIPNAVWHMIGHIQSRKAPQVANLFSWAHSVERLKVAHRLSESAQEAGRTLHILLEVNVSGEETKSGFRLEDWPLSRNVEGAFVEEARAIASLPQLHVNGLMTIAPYSLNANDGRLMFQRLAALRNLLRDKVPETNWEHLSMGMSGDFEVAVEEGSTIVRLGTALFGPRAT